MYIYLCMKMSVYKYVSTYLNRHILICICLNIYVDLYIFINILRFLYEYLSIYRGIQHYMFMNVIKHLEEIANAYLLVLAEGGIRLGMYMNLFNFVNYVLTYVYISMIIHMYTACIYIYIRMLTFSSSLREGSD
jgi:hypothetical protein